MCLTVQGEPLIQRPPYIHIEIPQHTSSVYQRMTASRIEKMLASFQTTWQGPLKLRTFYLFYVFSLEYWYCRGQISFHIHKTYLRGQDSMDEMWTTCAFFLTLIRNMSPSIILYSLPNLCSLGNWWCRMEGGHQSPQIPINLLMANNRHS